MYRHLFWVGLALLASSSAARADLDNAYGVVVLRGLDKVTARISEFEVEAGETISFGTLSIGVEICFETPPSEPPESAAFLKIEEIDGAAGGQHGFSGWMYASEPGYSALEHPVYDIWVVDCREPLAEDEVPSADNTEVVAD